MSTGYFESILLLLCVIFVNSAEGGMAKRSNHGSEYCANALLKQHWQQGIASIKLSLV